MMYVAIGEAILFIFILFVLQTVQRKRERKMVILLLALCAAISFVAYRMGKHGR